MSVLTFRGVRYERGSQLSNSEVPVQRLVYRSPAQEKRVIRSAPTAALLQLEDPKEETPLVYRSVPVRPLQAKRLDRAPIQRGGIIRSRMTAELLGINPVKAAGAPVHPHGVVRSRATAHLLGLDSARSKPTRVYRGIAY
ncbi:hypothetical protein [Synechococcus sp. KORDI-52]|uniref:hypothetical protein n=1 Tax=Synechococcus sp. KORDI-52 TaxID=585425 RepID=UPI0012EC690C|nr:hypothetical protein [Synechococcus sp. KORDI-52]